MRRDPPLRRLEGYTQAGGAHLLKTLSLADSIIPHEKDHTCDVLSRSSRSSLTRLPSWARP
jgi:hypothetical protein